MIRNKQLFIRKTHRYLGLFIGIQFLGWTVSGLYFSWNDLDSVHGDHLRKHPTTLHPALKLASPNTVLENLQLKEHVHAIHTVQLISIVGRPLYQVAYFPSATSDAHSHPRYALADATTGALREPLTGQEAVALARDYVVTSATFAHVERITSSDGHSEYRKRPLPAYAVTFNDPDCTIYISPELGTFQTIRHDQWRAFDFLWMFHTMDYQSRDNFNNWLLKIFSLFGLFTVFSGFILYIVSSPFIRRLASSRFP